jgi:hypothetical protein
MATTIVDGDLILEGLEYLLTNYPYHPVLWTLYAVNKRLAGYKPRLGKSIEIFYYRRVENPWLGGVTESVRDILAIDDKTGKDDKGKDKECWYAYATIREGTERVGMYWIPREWVKRIVVNERQNFMLLPYEFCCRQVLKRSDCKIVRCQSNFIPKKFFVDQYYFHVGCGGCNEEISTIIANFPTYVGIKQLVLALEDKSVTVRPDEVVLLLAGGDNLKLSLENVEKHKEPCSFTAMYVRTVLQHILLCIQCNKYLKKFIGILERCLSGGGEPLKDCEEISCELVLNNGIPCNRYVIDGEFDQMREIAYNAIQTQYCLERDPHKIVDNFIKDYYK